MYFHLKMASPPTTFDVLSRYNRNLVFDSSTLNSQLQLHCPQIYCLHEISFHFWMNRYIFRYKSMKSVKIKRNRQTTRVRHRFLPIDLYNRYQSNQIYRFLLIYRLINQYRFLSIDYSGVLGINEQLLKTSAVGV